ncbi:hypothetical protein [Pseudooceanicola sp. MF1-13]|uniref:hypothetical protein n=1 Tax=Pseudooceanicola sp. MF1-13 TaxID=3379095 RepID=UPI0038917B50
MTYDRSEIMTEAWKIVRRFLGNGETLGGLLSRALKSVWWTAKEKVRAARLVAEREAKQRQLAERSAASIRAELTDMENRDTLGHAGMARMDELRNALRAADAREAAAAEVDYKEKRELIASSNGRICAVTFIKKDGSERVMKVQPAALKFHVKGDEATEAGRKAAETRAVRHPNLLPVWDAENKAPRSVNLATITRIAVGGHVHLFTA